MAIRNSVPANQLLDMLAVVQDRDGPPGFMKLHAVCVALDRDYAAVTRLVRELETLEAVRVDWIGNTVFLTRDGYLIARPGEQTYPLPRLGG